MAIVTLDCHDLFPARVMVGKELEPKSWFSKTSSKESYIKNIWWPHLLDRPSIHQVLDMLQTEKYEFESKKRLKLKDEN